MTIHTSYFVQKHATVTATDRRHRLAMMLLGNACARQDTKAKNVTHAYTTTTKRKENVKVSQ